MQLTLYLTIPPKFDMLGIWNLYIKPGYCHYGGLQMPVKELPPITAISLSI